MLSSDALRRRFVEGHLIERLPVKSMAAVDRVDVTPWTVQTGTRTAFFGFAWASSGHSAWRAIARTAR